MIADISTIICRRGAPESRGVRTPSRIEEVSEVLFELSLTPLECLRTLDGHLNQSVVMVLRWLVVALAAVDGMKRERHGADVAS